MNPIRWKKIEELFNSAVSLTTDERRIFLSENCDEDPGLKSEVESLLTESEIEDSFLSSSLLENGLTLIGREKDELAPGRKIGIYLIKKLIARGGMGDVYLAEDTSLNRLVALKKLISVLTENPENIRRFKKEARVLSALSHPNIAHIYEISQADDLHFLVMEYIEGISLREFLQDEKRDIKQRIGIILQIARALEASHQKGIIHRDIKPENILIGPDERVKVLDFGLAKLTDTGKLGGGSRINSEMFETIPGMIMGTTSYMAPEQVRGLEVGEFTDVWSLGVVFYELLTGQRPFLGATQADIIAQILKGEIKRPREINPLIPKPIEIIILKALEKEPENRFQVISEMRKNLEKSFGEIDFSNLKVESGNEPVFFKQKKNWRKRVSSSWRIWCLGLAAAILLFSAFLYFWMFDNFFSGPDLGPESIAVLPFVNVNNEPENEYLSDGLTESIIRKLSNLPELTVKARNSSFRYKGKTGDRQKIGQELAVQVVLSGRVFKVGEKITIEVDLTDVKQGKVIWSKKYEGDLKNIIPLQNKIVEDVSGKMLLRITPEKRRNLNRVSTTNWAAYQAYLKGRYYWNKRTGKDLQKSVEYLKAAVAQDPDFALAYAGLADSYVLLSGYGVSSPEESFPKAKEAAQKALELDESLAEAHTALGYVLFNYDWDFEASNKEMLRAIELNPNYPTAHHWYGNANLLATGQFEEAVAEEKIALELDPLSIIINADLGTTLLFSRRTDEAIEQLNKTIDLDENFFYARVNRGRALLMKGDYERAIKDLKKAETLNPDPLAEMFLCRTYAQKGDRAEALKSLKRLEQISKTHYIPAYYFAIIFAGFGEKDKTFEFLNEALKNREGTMTLLAVDPLFDGIRTDPRFPELVKNVGLKVSPE
ncbi:MAG: protein kinase [Pyrinomonadaceae bacterium]